MALVVGPSLAVRLGAFHRDGSNCGSRFGPADIGALGNLGHREETFPGRVGLVSDDGKHPVCFWKARPRRLSSRWQRARTESP
jgi:hypothetical protein